MPWRSTSAAPAALHPVPRAAPPRADVRLGSWTIDSTAELRQLRAQLREALHMPRQVAAPVLLVASELATNALHHGVPPVVVALARTGDAHLLDVADRSLDEVPTYSAYRPAGEGGFGLYVVGRLANDVGWYVEAGRKHVWATLPR